jgi:hypothetical protein
MTINLFLPSTHTELLHSDIMTTLELKDYKTHRSSNRIEPLAMKLLYLLYKIVRHLYQKRLLLLENRAPD